MLSSLNFKKFKTQILISFIIFFLSISVYPEYIVLNDGTSVEGTIVDKNKDTITIRDSRNRIKQIPQKDISIMLKTVKVRTEQSKKQTAPPGQVTNSESDYLFSFKPGVIFPLFKFGEVSKTGYGFSAELIRKKYFLNKFDSGIEAGFFYSEGKDLMDSRSQIYNRFFIVPLYLSAFYRSHLTEKISIIPVLSVGATYLDVKYKDHSTGPLSESESHKKLFEPSLKAGISLNWNFTEKITIGTGFDYGFIFEKKGILHFTIFNINAGYNF